MDDLDGAAVVFAAFLGFVAILLDVVWYLGLIVGTVFLILQLAGTIAWSWGLVLLPYIIAVVGRIITWALGITLGVSATQGD